MNLDILLARIKAVFRRVELTPPSSSLETPLVVGELSLDPTAHEVKLRGQPVELPPLEFAILHLLMLNPGRVISNEEILAAVWGPEFTGQPQAVYVHIRWLRAKIEVDPNSPKRILTIHGVGYKLEVGGK